MLDAEPADALAARLQDLADQIARSDPDFAAAAEAFIARLKAAQAGSQAPAAGAPMPDFMLPDAQGGLASLASFSGRPLVAAFLRGHWCPFCQAQAEALSTASEAIAAMGAAVAFITPELPRYSRTLIEAAPHFALLSDLDNGYAASLGLLAVIDDDLALRLAAKGFDLRAYQGAAGWAVPIPATFVLDRSGVIVDRAFDPDYRKRPRMLALLEAVQRASEAAYPRSTF